MNGIVLLGAVRHFKERHSRPAPVEHGFAGFMENRNRVNVAMTRAKGVFWMIGGRMKMSPEGKGGGRGRRQRKRGGLITEYKRELDESGQTHRFRVN